MPRSVKLAETQKIKIRTSQHVSSGRWALRESCVEVVLEIMSIL